MWYVVWYRFAEKNMQINGNMHKKQLAQNNTSQGNCKCQTNQFCQAKKVILHACTCFCGQQYFKQTQTDKQTQKAN